MWRCCQFPGTLRGYFNTAYLTPLLQFTDRTCEVPVLTTPLRWKLQPIRGIRGLGRSRRTEPADRRRDEGMGVDHVDQVVARHQHVAPCAQPFSYPSTGRNLEVEQRLENRRWLRRIGPEWTCMFSASLVE